MKKLLLAAVTFFSLGLLWNIPVTVSAAEITSTTEVSASSGPCEDSQATIYDEHNYNYNDRVTLRFKNVGDTPLEVRNVPGGSFVVKAGKTTERSFTAKGSFVYSIWSTDTDCEKGTARVEVSGGWLIRIWPWALALVGSVAVIWIVSKTGHKLPPRAGKPTA
jgi:hypothetical protein